MDSACSTFFAKDGSLIIPGAKGGPGNFMTGTDAQMILDATAGMASEGKMPPDIKLLRDMAIEKISQLIQSQKGGKARKKAA